MSKYLWNRQCQLRLLVFRPFVAILAQHHNSHIPSERLNVLVDGARRYLGYSIQFFNSQSLQPERHYGSWLLCRNLWTTALTMLAACNTPALFHRMSSHGSMGSPVAFRSESVNDTHPSPSEASQDSICAYSDVLSGVSVAMTIMGYWIHESPSLAACLNLLTVLLTKTRERHG